MAALDVDQLLLEAEAKWSLGDDVDAVAILEEALTSVWGLPDEVARVSETATRLAAARASEPLDAFSKRAAEAARSLADFATHTRDVSAAPPERRRYRFGLIQLAVFTIVVVGLLVVQYLRVPQ